MYVDAFLWWLSGGVSMLSGVVFWMVAARMIEAHEIGPGAAAISAVTLLSAVSNLGLGLGLVRFLPEAGNEGARLLNAVLLFGAAAGALASTAVLAVAWAGGLSLDLLTAHPARAAFYVAFVALDTMLVIANYALMAARRMDLSLLQTLLLNALRIPAIALLGVTHNSFGIVVVWGLGEAAAIVLALGWLLPRAHPGYRFALVRLRFPARGLVRFSIGNQAAYLLSVMPAAVLPWLVIHQTGNEAGAAYAYVALAIATAVMNVSISLALALLAEGARNVEALRMHARRVLALAFGLSAAAFVVLFAGAPLALGVFGSEYGDNATALLRGLLLGALIGAPAQVLIGELRVRKDTARVIALAAAINVPMVLIAAALLPSRGIDAVAVAWVAGHCIGAAGTAVHHLAGRARIAATPAVLEVEP